MHVCNETEKQPVTLSDIANQYRSHDLVLSKALSDLGLHGIGGALKVGVLDERKAERTTAVLVAGELGYGRVSITLHTIKDHVYLQMAVSAFSGVSNSTTPVPRERPLGSY